MSTLRWPTTIGLCLLFARAMASVALEEAGSPTLVPAENAELISSNGTTVKADLGSARASEEHVSDK